jgi:hypothetical protein
MYSEDGVIGSSRRLDPAAASERNAGRVGVAVFLVLSGETVFDVFLGGGGGLAC